MIDPLNSVQQIGETHVNVHVLPILGSNEVFQQPSKSQLYIVSTTSYLTSFRRIDRSLLPRRLERIGRLEDAFVLQYNSGRAERKGSRQFETRTDGTGDCRETLENGGERDGVESDT